MSQTDKPSSQSEDPAAVESAVHQAVRFDEELRASSGHSPAEMKSFALAGILRLLHDVLRSGTQSSASGAVTLALHAADSSYEASQDLTFDSLVNRISLPIRFQIRRLLGKGGFGSVYLATDRLLQRDVAIKVPHRTALENEELRIRFLRESQALARLNHPSIVRVLDSGSCDGSAWQVTEYVDGPRLSDFRREHGDALPAVVAARILSQLADGVQHAHDQGVLHRDIKPDNILMEQLSVRSEVDDTAPQMIPRLTDFGLARLVDEDTTISRSGLLIGTPMYMAPEQLKGQPARQGPWTDIYSLGVVLYELLNGTIPFPEATSLHARVSVAERPVDGFRKSTPGISRDIETICLKCLSHHPEERYATAALLRDDLLRFLDGRPTLARPLPIYERFSRWVQRNRSLAASLAVVIASVLIILSQTINSDRASRAQNLQLTQTLNQLKQEKTRSDLLRDLADKTRVEAENNESKFRLLAWNSSFREAFAGLLDQQYFSVREILRKLRVSQPENLHRPEWQLAAAELSRHFEVVFEAEYSLNELRAVPGTSLLAVAGKSSIVSLIDFQTHRLVRSFSTDIAEIHAMAVSADGKLIAVGGTTNSDDVSIPAIYSVETGMLVRTLSPQATTIESLLFTSDGKFLVCGCRYEPVRIFDLEKGTESSLPTTRRNQWLLEGPDTTRVIAHKERASILIADPRSPSAQRMLTLSADIEYGMLIPGSNLLACTSYQSEFIEVLDLESGKVCGRLRHSGKAFTSIAFSSFHRELVAGREDGSIVSWSIPVAWVQPIAIASDIQQQGVGSVEIVESHSKLLDDQAVSSMVSIDDTLYCTTAGGRLTLYRYAQEENAEVTERVVDKSPWRSATINSTNGDVLIGTTAGEILLSSGPELTTVTSARISIAAQKRDGRARVAFLDEHAVDCIAVARNSDQVAWSNWTQQLHTGDLGAAERQLLAPKTDDQNGGVDAVCLSDSGRIVAWTGSDKRISIRKLDGFSETREFPLPGYGNALCFSSDARFIACGGSFDRLVIIDTETVQEKLALNGCARCSAITWSKQGKSLLLGFANGSVSVRSLTDPTSTSFSLHRNEVRQIALHPDFDFAASVDQSGQVALWNPVSGEFLGVLFEPGLATTGIVSMAPTIDFIGSSELMLVYDDGDSGPQVLRWQLRANTLKSDTHSSTNISTDSLPVR